MRKAIANVIFLVTVSAFFVSSAFAGEKGGATQKSFLWQVRSKSATVFILGSIHMAKPDMYPLAQRIEESFTKAGALALEADPAKAGDQNLLSTMLAAALYPDNQTLKEHLSPKSYELASREMEQLGLPMESFNKSRPWFLAMTIEVLELQHLGYDPAYGIDVYFAGKAQGNKRIIELESFDYQIRLLNGFSDHEQELFLLYTLQDLKQLKDETGELMTAWRDGDAKAMEDLAIKTPAESPEMRPILDKLIYRRNREMAAKIGGFLQGKETVFVVVGAAHLVGKEGVIELLRGKGFTVEQM
ncbi:MAG TPA: TraB/GumN family protein [Geobacteraceae bacterium]|nr:TraB/GumN family protein [Geobacteraceae bacterium]